MRCVLPDIARRLMCPSLLWIIAERDAAAFWWFLVTHALCFVFFHYRCLLADPIWDLTAGCYKFLVHIGVFHTLVFNGMPVKVGAHVEFDL